MPFSIHPSRRFPIQFAVTYNTRHFKGKAPCRVSSILGASQPSQLETALSRFGSCSFGTDA